MSANSSVDVQAYYRQITDLDIAQIARELLPGRVAGETRDTLHCDCPNHQSQSHRSLHVWLDKQGWYCFGCGVGGDVLQLVEFIQCGHVTRGQSGPMPESHRQARDFLASRAGLPSLLNLAAGGSAEAEEAHAVTLRVREALTELAEFYHQRLLATPGVLAWFQEKYGISDEIAGRLKIGFAANTEPSVIRALMDGPGAFTKRELAATSAFRPTAQDGLIPFFDGRIVFPYWSRGRVVFMIGRQTPWTPDQLWEKSKYKKLAVQNDRDGSHVAPCIRNDVLYNEDVLLTRPERVIITEGVTDCISLMQYGFPTVSPVTVQIREADWARLLPKLRGVKTVYICQDNEISEAGMNGAVRTARTLAENGILTRLAILPLGEKQQKARGDLREQFGVEGSATPRELAKLLDGKQPTDIQHAQTLFAYAKIDVNEYFAAGKTAADFEVILAAAQTPLELAISQLATNTPDQNLSPTLEPILAEVGRLAPLEQDRHLRLIQARCGKDRVPVGTLRKQLKVIRIDRRGGGGRRSREPASPAVAAISANPQSQAGASGPWKDGLLLALNGTIKPILANSICALRGAPEWTGVLAYNDFALNTVVQQPAPWMHPDGQFPARWTGTDDIQTANWLQVQGIYVSPQVAGQAVEVVAKDRKIHPVREYLEGLTWDGVPRLSSWLPTYLGVEPSPYVAAVGSCWMIAAVARILRPGVKADTCLILEGPQGIKKSTALRTLTQPWFTDEIAELGSKDAALQLQGVWVIEIAELDSMSRAEVGRVKSFMSQLSDRFRPPYAGRLIDAPRQCVFAGSVNHSTYLRDETGGRRFWPVECKAPVIDIDGLAGVRDQLWAEAAAQFFDGKPWWLESRELNRDAAEEQSDRYEGDPWDQVIAEWVSGRETVSITDVLRFCIEKRMDQWTQIDKNRVARCLRAQGWERFNSGTRRARQWRYRMAKEQ